jgi:hypothetical protein
VLGGVRPISNLHARGLTRPIEGRARVIWANRSGTGAVRSRLGQIGGKREPSEAGWDESEANGSRAGLAGTNQWQTGAEQSGLAQIGGKRKLDGTGWDKSEANGSREGLIETNRGPTGAVRA